MTTYSIQITYLGGETYTVEYIFPTEEQAIREAESDHQGATVTAV